MLYYFCCYTLLKNHHEYTNFTFVYPWQDIMLCYKQQFISIKTLKVRLLFPYCDIRFVHHHLLRNDQAFSYLL